ncbi:hypothetical protein CSV79_01510 [Sporosarcina sp. P13]|uniref:hypothetical protein n=1 Tax=Sporosarcina sp. P13 TaxID=2048263 RepID=UPI000C16BCD1|nr:hypothetical protein [Sporosarcina sp. P13]PIC65327.1 hypothetical protein CSV79_01510 [Sporosarcina sp. P13]
MAEKNIQMTQRNTANTGWDDLFPKTKAENVAINPISGLTGANVQIAMQNLFQFANDGKTRVANAVTAKGVAASPADTFAVLATKIGQINTGAKWASGKSIYTDSSYDGGYLQPVNNLGFRPNFIIAWTPTTRNPGVQQEVIYVSLELIQSLSFVGDIEVSGAPSQQITKSGFNITDNGFQVRQITRSGSTGDVWNWIALKI